MIVASERAVSTGPKPVPDSLTRLGYKIRRFGPLPEGFNPLTATNEQLAEQWLPRRPDEQTEPKRRALWERSLARVDTWIEPEFAEPEHRVRTVPEIPPLPVTGAPPPDPFSRSLTSGNWAGALQLAYSEYPHTFVAGQWTVPHLTVDHATILSSKEPNEWDAVQWVGIDGYLGSDDLVQIGTSTKPYIPLLFPNDPVEISVSAWWQWVPHNSVPISNLKVSLGDVVFCLICADDSMTGATMYFTNVTTQVGTRFHVTAPAGIKLAGSSAEWIVERPNYGTYQHPSFAELPDYGQCNFDECFTGSGGKEFFLDDPTLTFTVWMATASGDLLSEAQIESENQLTVTWYGSS
jgi:hypothetical protein